MSPATADALNGAFEFLGALLVWNDVRVYASHRRVVGIYWPSRGFFTAWGLWNCFYYPALGQWFSFAGGVLIATGNLAWLGWVIYDVSKKEKS